MFDNVPAVPLKLRSKSAPSGSSKPYALTRQQREASTYSQECSDLQLGRDGTMRRLLPGFHHCPALCKQVGLVRLRHRFSIHFPCTLHLLSPFVKSFFLPAKIRKRQGLNAEKSKILFCALFTKAILPPQYRPAGQAPAIPVRHTSHPGCRAGIRLPTAAPAMCPPLLSR